MSATSSSTGSRMLTEGVGMGGSVTGGQRRPASAGLGVEELWLVAPEAPVARVWDGVLSSPLLPGFALTVGDQVRW